LDLKQIKGIISLMESSNLTEFEIEEKDLKLRIKRGKENDACGVAPVVTAVVPAPTSPATADSAPAPSEEEDGVTVIKSPMVGTFYRSPSPDNPPYVENGQKIAKGAVLCIIEAMKVMNEIKADSSGIVTETLVENGENVEFGQPLFKVKA